MPAARKHSTRQECFAGNGFRAYFYHSPVAIARKFRSLADLGSATRRRIVRRRTYSWHGPCLVSHCEDRRSAGNKPNRMVNNGASRLQTSKGVFRSVASRATSGNSTQRSGGRRPCHPDDMTSLQHLIIFHGSETPVATRSQRPGTTPGPGRDAEHRLLEDIELSATAALRSATSRAAPGVGPSLQCRSRLFSRGMN